MYKRQGNNYAKYRDMFRRRVSRGQCYHTPYLGCREFSAFFGESSGDEQPVPIDDDLGLMLFDMDFVPDGSGKAKPIFFHAYLKQGVLSVPEDLYQQRG